jgi:hypothetical protein
MRPRLMAAVLLLYALPGLAGQAGHFYDVDTEVRIEGTVREVSFELLYKDRAPFVMLTMEKSGSGQKFLIETGPSWFFGEDLHAGQTVAVVGSLVRAEGDIKYVIAREIRFGGETIVVRDRSGFPEWRGGKAQRMRRRGRGF